jgi:hypothetical protein
MKFKKLRQKKYSAVEIIFSFEFHRKRIVAILFELRKAFSKSLLETEMS